MNGGISKFYQCFVRNDVDKLRYLVEEFGLEFLKRDEFLIPCISCENNLINCTNKSCIHVCAYFNSIECLLYLFSLGFNPNSKDSTGFLPLHFAIFGEAVDAVVILLRYWNDPNSIPINTNLSPLFIAARMGNVKIIQILFHYHAIYPNPKYLSPALEALRCNKNEAFKILFKHECDKSVTNKKDFTPLMLAIANKMDEAINILIEDNNDIDTVSTNGVCALSLACQDRNLKLIEKLILRGYASLSVKAAGGSSLIHWAGATCSPEILKFVINCGANVMDRTDRGESALSFVLRFIPSNDKEINDVIESLKILLSNGLTFNEKLNDGSVPLLEYLIDKSKINEKILIFILSTNINLEMPVFNRTLKYFIQRMKFGKLQNLIDDFLSKTK
ncbi:hypothetical protein TVAG_423350 [Trichomonas vaginalis G3]|uniref:Uncharacterized protein n=1 Tax=Trichomonas vaginalis (strain ATCC PRA-98 / G3) TaxID=412133 RepID=A2DTH3_TRIV3|nr:spectrin binding [Trichomonas vaginalis G3]EAY16282.1 hypothetical protein TVAG_423350 [Trichomonas vaginalis G3]KAI5523432.1 spectrin binding [Trichomonas vaginalis G3]|eukprot:XP_001328505.1 hypothetical protein [Trichomonas vaginalis G3]